MLPIVFDEGNGGNYMEKIERLLEEVKDLPVGSYFTTAHDEWCDTVVGIGVCNCDPSVTLVRPISGG